MAYIMIVDDDEDLAKAFAKVLTDAQYEVEIEAEPRHALESMSRRPPDLVILDVMFPESSSAGFELARGRRKKLTSVDKANVLESSRLWRQVAMEVAQDYPDVALEHMLVDTCAMRILLTPRDFDVLVTENTFGDILTDEASMLAGSMGMLPSASLAGIPKAGEKTFGLFEPIHGSAPTIAGKGIANPIATILTLAMLLRYSLGLETEAAAVESAVSRAIDRGVLTADVAPSGTPAATTVQAGQAVVDGFHEARLDLALTPANVLQVLHRDLKAHSARCREVAADRERQRRAVPLPKTLR
jgi:CheY-like chemotaxis protein